MTLKLLLGTLDTIIQNHFKFNMIGLMLKGIVYFLKLLEIGMHTLILLYLLLNILRIASLVLSFVDPGECMSVDMSPVSYSDSDSDKIDI